MMFSIAKRGAARSGRSARIFGASVIIAGFGLYSTTGSQAVIGAGYGIPASFIRVYEPRQCGPGGNLKLCFANAGDLQVFIQGVYSMNSGDNSGWLGTNKRKFYFGKFENRFSWPRRDRVN